MRGLLPACLALAALAALTSSVRRATSAPTVLWTEDTVLDKMSMEHIAMCCSQVPHPCCTSVTWPYSQSVHPYQFKRTQ